MTQHEIRIVKLLIAVVKAAEIALDNSFYNDDMRELSIGDSQVIEDALDELDQLPNDRPDYELAAWGKAEWALRNLIGEPE